MPLLADVQWVGLTEPETADAEPWLARLLVGLRGVGLNPAGSIAWDLRRSPYPGLVPFASEDAAVFARLDAPEALGAGEVRAELAAEVEAALPFN